MSWSMWHVYGSGFDVAKADPEKYGDFLKKHQGSWPESNTKQDVLRYLYGHAGIALENIDLDTIQEMTDSNTLAEPVVTIMYQETGIRFSLPNVTDNGEDYVLFCNMSPWEYNDAEKALTLDSLMGILQRYADELGLEAEPDVDLVYAG